MGSVFSGWTSCGGTKGSDVDSTALARCASPYVRQRKSSMFMDEDGDFAHEFYEEVKPKKRGQKAWMRRITEHLIPEGIVDLPYPRIHIDIPVVLTQV